MKHSLIALFIIPAGCAAHRDAPVETSYVGAEYEGCQAFDWTADDISEDYYPWSTTTDSQGVVMGVNGPWTLTIGPPPQLVDVAPPISTPQMQKGTDWDIREDASGNCQLIFYTAAPYTVRANGASVFIAGAAAAAAANGQPFKMRRAERNAGVLPANVDLSLYSDSGGGAFGIGALAIPLGQLALPNPKQQVANAAAAVAAINARSAALQRPIVVAFLAHGNVGIVALQTETITTANAKDKFLGARGSVDHQRQISCLAGTPATPQVLELIADGLTGAQVATVGGYDAVVSCTPFGFFTTGTYHEYHGE